MAWKPGVMDLIHWIEGTGLLFLPLSDEEEQKFRQHARNNDPPEGDSWSIYHPISREEWIKRGLKEQS